MPPSIFSHPYMILNGHKYCSRLHFSRRSCSSYKAWHSRFGYAKSQYTRSWPWGRTSTSPLSSNSRSVRSPHSRCTFDTSEMLPVPIPQAYRYTELISFDKSETLPAYHITARRAMNEMSDLANQRYFSSSLTYSRKKSSQEGTWCHSANSKETRQSAPLWRSPIKWHQLAMDPEESKTKSK